MDNQPMAPELNRIEPHLLLSLPHLQHSARLANKIVFNVFYKVPLNTFQNQLLTVRGTNTEVETVRQPTRRFRATLRSGEKEKVADLF